MCCFMFAETKARDLKTRSSRVGFYDDCLHCEELQDEVNSLLETLRIVKRQKESLDTGTAGVDEVYAVTAENCCACLSVSPKHHEKAVESLKQEVSRLSHQLSTTHNEYLTSIQEHEREKEALRAQLASVSYVISRA